MNDEVLKFAENVGAIDLKEIYKNSIYQSLFNRRNYFLLDGNKYLIIKISRSKIRTFWGLGKKHFDFFNSLTKKNGEYYFVALDSDKSGWVISKKELLSQISEKTLSYSEKQKQFKINNYNLKFHNSFSSVKAFLEKCDSKNHVVV